MLNSAVVTAVERFVTASDEPVCHCKEDFTDLEFRLAKVQSLLLVEKEQKRNCTHSHSDNGAESCADYSKIPHCHKKNVKHNVCATRQYRENKHDMWLVCCYKVRLVEHLPAHYKAIRNHNAAVVNAVGENLFV